MAQRQWRTRCSGSGPPWQLISTTSSHECKCGVSHVGDEHFVDPLAVWGSTTWPYGSDGGPTACRRKTVLVDRQGDRSAQVDDADVSSPWGGDGCDSVPVHSASKYSIWRTGMKA